MVFLVLEAHGALHFGGGANERAQGIARKRVVVSAGIHVLKLAGLMVATLGVGALEKKTFNFVGRVERVTFLLVHVFGKGFEQAADVGGVGLATFVDDVAEDQDFTGTKNVGRAPVERTPIHVQAQVAFALRG